MDLDKSNSELPRDTPTYAPMRTPVTPASSRLYDRLLGGTDNYLSDREILAGLPDQDFARLSTAARINAEHNALIARHLAGHGYEQFLDLGCGLPSLGSYSCGSTPLLDVHDAVFDVQPDARMIYVDIDPTVVGLRRMATEGTSVATVQGDLRDMSALLTSDQVTGRLDLTRPVVLLLHDVLAWIAEPDLSEALRELRAWAPVGSVLSITHAADMGPTMPSKLTPLIGEVADASDLTFCTRDSETIARFFGAWQWLAPGLVPTHYWHRAHPRRAAAPHQAGAYAGVAVKEWVRRVNGPVPEAASRWSSRRAGTPITLRRDPQVARQGRAVR